LEALCAVEAKGALLKFYYSSLRFGHLNLRLFRGLVGVCISTKNKDYRNKRQFLYQTLDRSKCFVHIVISYIEMQMAMLSWNLLCFSFSFVVEAFSRTAEVT
jgi:hypothetical protein